MGETAAGPDVLRAWHEAADAQLARVLDIVPADVAEELGRALPRIRAELAALETPAEPPALQRVHGDFHIGQILAAGDRLVVLDFEGEPTRPVADRAAPGTALRDVAAMLRSFDHLGRHVEHERWPGHRDDIERWIDAARAAFLDAYGPVDRGLLRALEFEKACYEFVYAAEFEPVVGVRAAGRGCAGSWSTPWLTSRPELLTPDVARDAGRGSTGSPIAHAGLEPLALQARRVLFLGMGSSRYAALNAAAYLRSLGRDAHAEHASSGAPQPPEPRAARRRHLRGRRLGARRIAATAQAPGHEHGRWHHQPATERARVRGRHVPRAARRRGA